MDLDQAVPHPLPASAPTEDAPADAPRVAFATVGCRLNQAETDAAMEDFAAHGWRVVPFKEEADLYFINTCTVTGRADRSSRQLIHRARRRSGRAMIVAVGCFAERAARELADEGEVDVVLGVREKARPFDYLPEDMTRPPMPLIHVDEERGPARSAVGTRVSGRSRAFLKVQDGCDHSCAYCAVTLVRGPSRSVPIEDIRQALHRVRGAGFEEVVLTGVDLTAWGRDLPDERRDFVDLVAEAAEAGIPRVRVSSMEPWELSPERIARLADVEAWCEHFHLSLQSGDEALLERMGRQTDLGRLRESLAELLRRRPHATLGADIIAGFPGETEQAFENTLRFLDNGPLHYLHVFPFSARPGTPAAEMADRVDHETIHNRAEILRREGRIRRRRRLSEAVGGEAEILVETNGKGGYTRSYLRTRLEGDEAEPRTRVRALLTSLDDKDDILYAKVIP